MRERELCSLLFGLADPSGFHPVKLMPGAPRGPFEIPRDLRVIPRDPLLVRPQANRIIFVMFHEGTVLRVFDSLLLFDP